MSAYGSLVRGARSLLLLATVACNANSAPGNDREAALDRAAPPIRSAAAGAAVAGVDVPLLHPETMTSDELATIDPASSSCLFRMTEVGFPVLAFGGEAGGSATMKMNGTLFELPSEGAGGFAADGIRVRVGLLDEGERPGPDPRDAELIVTLPGAPHPLGYHGFLECTGG